MNMYEGLFEEKLRDIKNYCEILRDRKVSYKID